MSPLWDANGIYRVKARNTAKHPTMHSTVPATRRIQLKMPIAPRGSPSGAAGQLLHGKR